MPDCLFDNRNISRQDRFPFKKTVLFHPYPGKIKNNAERQKNQEQRRKTEKARTTQKDRKIKNNAQRQKNQEQRRKAELVTTSKEAK